MALAWVTTSMYAETWDVIQPSPSRATASRSKKLRAPETALAPQRMKSAAFSRLTPPDGTR